ncbi:hypothetical protein LTR84_011491 [Exophiala bonariae]|uniref:Tuftelin interacting protein N-terminal domain-containing protein n=1 Tax=Exophiala bonariae TaxID=1690606 RepID=A0AAV9NGK7_9EURO|nr:hypothetical protein LTR84_011491 [Exophiala bonariae]
MLLTKRERGKRPRRESSDELYIEELSPDDIGYDGDAEVLRPDEYEDVDSDFEDEKHATKVWPSTEEELARQLELLACGPEITGSSRLDEGDVNKKRRSKEMEHESLSANGGHADFEVSEMVDGQAEQRPIKKRRKRASQYGIAYRLGRKHVNGTWSDSSDRTDDREMPFLIESSCSGTPEATPVPEVQSPRVEIGDDAMDIE